MTAPTSRVVRVFISSTFRDFGAERDLLMKRVFPELRRRARARFVEVIGVDLRWGITEEESEKGETLPICLREIERSRPYFVCLLGERYGWTPAAGQYPELLLEQQPWLREFAGGKSVTELEILHGVLNAPEMAGRAYFYFRDPAFSEGKGADYASEDEDARGKLARLKERIRGSAFPVAGFATPEEAADRITDDLWRLIDAEYPEDAVPDELERERRSHEAYAAERRRLYIGQEETVAALLARLEDASDEPGEEGSRTRTTLVTAESGTGKSALIANTLARYREAHPDHVVIEHYIGSTSEASDPLKVIRRVSEEIRRLTGVSREVEDDPEKLVEQFVEWLAEASWWAGRRGVRVVLALDALDKLSERSDLRWLPKVTAPHVRLVVSSLDGATVEAMRKRQPGEVQARPFTPEVARNYIVETLARRGRRLPVREVDRIVSHPRAMLPIYLKTLVEELCVFGSHEGLSRRITECLAAQEPDDLFEVILARLEEDLGCDAVKKPLEAIWASSEGMSEDELVGFTGVSPLELARLRLSLDDVLYEAGGLLRLAHAYEAKSVEDRYAPTDEARRELHRALGLWWEMQEPGARMANELCLHFFAAQRWDELWRCLTAPNTGSACMLWVPDRLLHSAWSAIAQDRQVGSVSMLLEMDLARQWRRWIDVLSQQDHYELTLFMAYFLLQIGCDGPNTLQVHLELVAMQRKAYESTPSESNLDRVGVALQRLGLLEHARGNLSGARSAYQESVEFARRFAGSSRDAYSIRSLNVSLNSLGQVCEQLGDTDEMASSHREALSLARLLWEQDPSITHGRDLAVSLSLVSRVEAIEGNTAAAIERQSESLSVLEAVLGEADDLEVQMSMAQTQFELGILQETCGDPEAALCWYRRSLETAKTVVKRWAKPDWVGKLCCSLYAVARAELLDGRIEPAADAFVDMSGWAQQLYARTPTERAGVTLASSLLGMGDIRLALNDMDGARSYFEKCLGLCRALWTKHGGSECRAAMCVSLDRCVEVAIRAESFDRAHELAVERMDHAAKEYGEDESPRARESLLSSSLPMIRCELELGRLRHAAESASLVEGIVSALTAAFEDETVDRVEQELDSATLFRCADGMDLVARLRGLQGDEPKREEAAETAKSLRESAEQLKAEEDAATDEESSQ